MSTKSLNTLVGLMCRWQYFLWNLSIPIIISTLNAAVALVATQRQMKDREQYKHLFPRSHL